LYVLQAKAKSKLFIPPEFPDPHVAQAYLEPTVDQSTEPFVPATPDLDGLRRYPQPARGTRDRSWKEMNSFP